METNKALVRRFIDEVHNNGNFMVLDELFAPDYVNRSAPAGAADRAARARSIKTYREEVPDMRVTIDDIFAEGDRVALRWTTRGTRRSAQDRAISIPGINIFRVANGQIAEEWIVWDTLSWAQQLGQDVLAAR
jgi:steroid delta-isomerase-like uncharacterized protein